MLLALFAIGCGAAPIEDPAPPATRAAPRVAERPRCAPVAAKPPLDLPAARAPIDPPFVGLVRPETLAEFYDALARLSHGRAKDHVRIAFFGDSNLTMDFTTGRVRRNLQRRFGDGGHGFVALGKPWSHYQHMDVQHDIVKGWKAYAITTSPTGDGLYGLGGIAVESQYQGAKTFAATARPGAPVGERVGRFDLFYLERPGGGSIDVHIDQARVATVSTAGADKRLAKKSFDVEDGPHRFELTSVSPAGVRVFGVALERKEPGVVVDSFGVGALNTKTLGRHDPRAFADMLAARRYDLVVFLTGANDIFTMDAVPPTMAKLIGILRETLPRASVMLATPSDRGLRRSMKETLAVVAQRRELAAAEGLSLWDQFAVMGGEGSMAGFVREKLAFKDAVHFTEAGGALMGDRFVDALLLGFEQHLTRKPDAGCE